MPLPITTFLMMFFILPVIGVIEHLFPGSLETALESLYQTGFFDQLNDSVKTLLPSLLQILESDTVRTLVSPFNKLMEIATELGIFSP